MEMNTVKEDCAQSFSRVRENDCRGCLLCRWWEEHDMRNLRKNQRDMWYALYDKKIPILDENGDETGDYKMGYGPPVFFQASLSAGKGSVRANVFGVDVDYTRTISTTDMDLPITETSLIWYKTKPVLLEDGTADPNSADYEVAAPPADSLNVLVIALRERLKNG